MNKLYPMKFYPILKEKIWGGEKLRNMIPDAPEHAHYGEAWLLSGMEDNETVVANGWLAENDLAELTEIFMGDLVGDKVYEKYKEHFPLLFKLIDAADDLSIQVHPDDKLAKKREVGMGKTEMWYVLGAEKDASLVSGFSKPIERESFVKLLTQNRLDSVLNHEEVSPGDAFYIPAGRIHSIGKGILLAEIQQASDTTYRIYDWDRKDDKGKERPLHIAEALDAIDFKVEKDYRTHYQPAENNTVPMVQAPYFTTNILIASAPVRKDFSEMDTFIVYLCVEGAFDLLYDGGKEHITAGEIVLIPNAVNNISIVPRQRVKVLEVYVP